MDFSIVSTIQLFGKTLLTYVFTKYFHTLDLFERYPPGGCGRDAPVTVPSALLFLLRVRRLSEVTLAIKPAELASHRTSAGSPGPRVLFRAFLYCGVVVTTW